MFGGLPAGLIIFPGTGIPHNPADKAAMAGIALADGGFQGQDGQAEDDQVIKHDACCVADHAPLLIIITDGRYDGNTLEVVPVAQPLLKFNAACQWQTDVYDHRAILAQLSGDFIDASAGNAETIGNFLLCQTGNVVIPGNAGT